MVGMFQDTTTNRVLEGRYLENLGEALGAFGSSGE